MFAKRCKIRYTICAITAKVCDWPDLCLCKIVWTFNFCQQLHHKMMYFCFLKFKANSLKIDA